VKVNIRCTPNNSHQYSSRLAKYFSQEPKGNQNNNQLTFPSEEPSEISRYCHAPEETQFNMPIVSISALDETAQHHSSILQ
jgi:hypothetical protein